MASEMKRFMGPTPAPAVVAASMTAGGHFEITERTVIL